jgi:pimeloyl-ACP methyl ester carboxylesterase
MNVVDVRKADGDRPYLLGPEPDGPVRAAVLVLPGGRARSHRRTQAWNLTRLRMKPFARHLRELAIAPAVWTVGYRHRGWNGAEASPVADAEWALTTITRDYGEMPVVIVGHSMGGRTALRVAGYPAVVGVAALAPWLPDSEPIGQVAGRDLLFMHGSRDRTTDPKATQRYAKLARPIARSADYAIVKGEGHAMLRSPQAWHSAVADFTAACLADNTS